MYQPCAKMEINILFLICLAQQIYADTSNMVGNDNFMASITGTPNVVAINTLNSAHWWW